MTTTVPIHPLPEILLLTHGGWGLQLCNSLRMVMGEIEGVTEIALMPVDTLGEFYQRVEAVVKTMPEGSLIVTDFIGGTTSNVAARLSADYPVAVISGLNASLLLEALDKREHGPLTACVADLVEAGRNSCWTSSPIFVNYNSKENRMANIVLCRIDSRLIHGQVVTKWVGQSQANRIAVVSDELDADPFMKNIYLMAAPPNIKVDCFSNQSFAAAWKENQLGDGNVLVLFPSLAAIQEAVQQGFDVADIQVGGLGGGPNRKAVFQNITLDEKDVGILNDLKSRGIKAVFQTIPEDKPQSLDDILKKF